MTLSLRQQHDALQKVAWVGANLKNFIDALDDLADVRKEHGPEVETYLADVITVAEWQDIRARATTWHSLFQQRVNARLGDGLDALSDDE